MVPGPFWGSGRGGGKPGQGYPGLAITGVPPPPHCTGPGWLCGASGMPLAFTQEDYLVFRLFLDESPNKVVERLNIYLMFTSLFSDTENMFARVISHYIFT